MDTFTNFYSGQPPLNRVSFQRSNPTKINSYLADAKYIVYSEGKCLVRTGQPGEPYFLKRDDVASLVGDGFRVPSKSDPLHKAHEGQRNGPNLIFLGLDERGATPSGDSENPNGVAFFALDVSAQRGDDPRGADIGDWKPPSDGEWADNRLAGSSMAPWEAGIFAMSRPLIDWNGRNVHCPACGRKTYSLWAGWKRNCTSALDEAEKPKCFANAGLHNFAHPRTDPVIIMGILDSTGDKMLLGRQRSWPKGMYSCLAGFIEPGESFEEAVRREVLEEAGIEVGPVRYASSQPWPYPANLMVGCYGRAKDGQTIRLDLDNELEDAQWFPREYVANLAQNKGASVFSRADLQQLDKAQQNLDDEAHDLPAPHNADAARYAELTKMPPETAIAGVLMRQWALGAGGQDLVSGMSRL